jgi:uncharacterized SAM-binding protein YcdF (DUF218 family)
MNPGELKPILAALVLPPTGPMLLAVVGVLLMVAHRRRTALLVTAAAIGALWLLSCQGFAVWTAARLLPPVVPVSAAQLPSVQAIVVLGGGVLREAPEYGEAQPSGFTYGRLRYAARLARATGKPLAFAGGIGWASAGSEFPAEADVAARALQQDWDVTLRWSDSRSRDTQENADEMRRLMAGIERIALVTDAWHMPRSVRAFEAAGFTVIAAPTGFASPTTRPLLQWLPSAEGLTLSRQVIREWMGLRVQRRL